MPPVVDIPVLETDRLRLRGWRNDDLDAFAAFVGNDATARYIGGACGRQDAWRRMATQMGHWALRGYGAWALEEKVRGGWVGYCGIWNPEGWPEPEIMWGLAAPFHGRGYATEAARCARDHAYRRLGLASLISCIVPENSSSQRVAARLGATLERTMELRGMQVGIYRHPGPEDVTGTST